MELAFTIVRCDQGHVFPLGQRKSCPECGEVLDLVDTHVIKRSKAYGSGIARLQERLALVNALEYASGGTRDSLVEFRQWIAKNTFRKLLKWAGILTASMSSGKWSSPELEETRTSWTHLRGLANDAIDLVYDLKEKLPPPLMIAYHRIVTRAAEKFCESCVLFISALTAPSIEAAHAVKDQAQEALNASGSIASRSGALLNPVSDALERNLDLTSGSLELAADRERAHTSACKIFSELACNATADPAILRPLYPMLLPAAAMHDPDRRAHRFNVAYDRLVAATATPHANFVIADLVRTMVRASEELRDQHARLSTELIVSEARRNISVHTVLDVCSKLSEGPLRRLGAVIACADRVVQGSAFKIDEAELLGSAAPSKIITALKEVDDSLVTGIDQLTRNAGVHYDYEIDGGIVHMRHMHKGQTYAKIATADDLVTDAANLGEINLALLMAIVRWGWELIDSKDREFFRRAWLSGTS